MTNLDGTDRFVNVAEEKGGVAGRAAAAYGVGEGRPSRSSMASASSTRASEL